MTLVSSIEALGEPALSFPVYEDKIKIYIGQKHDMAQTAYVAKIIYCPGRYKVSTFLNLILSDFSELREFALLLDTAFW